MAVLKRSFYQMLGVESTANQACIDAAYAAMSVKLNVNVELHGASQAVTEKHLLREGYRMLSDPGLRASYDAKLLAAKSDAQVISFPDSTVRRRLGLESVIFAALVMVLVGIVYSQLTRKMADMRTEHQQTVAKKKEDQNRPVVMNVTSQGDANENSGKKGVASPAQ